MACLRYLIRAVSEAVFVRNLNKICDHRHNMMRETVGQLNREPVNITHTITGAYRKN